MGFYDLNIEQRQALTLKIHQLLLTDLKQGSNSSFEFYFKHEDLYVRKAAYLAISKIYLNKTIDERKIICALKSFSNHSSELVRQTVVNAAGEIGKYNFKIVQPFFDEALFDEHHKVRNAVIGSIKKMSEKNATPVLKFAEKYVSHPNKEIRREICHGIELRGRTHPQEVLPILKQFQFDKTKRVSKTLIHVLGQISYKEGCLEKVIDDLKTWENQVIVKEAIAEIMDVHKRYEKFSIYSQQQAIDYITPHFPQYI